MLVRGPLTKGWRHWSNPFDIYIPATEHRAAVKVNTIQIDVYTDEFGNEMVTP